MSLGSTWCPFSAPESHPGYHITEFSCLLSAFLGFPSFWDFPWYWWLCQSFRGVLIGYFIECPSVGIFLVFFSILGNYGFGEEDYRSKCIFVPFYVFLKTLSIPSISPPTHPCPRKLLQHWECLLGSRKWGFILDALQEVIVTQLGIHYRNGSSAKISLEECGLRATEQRPSWGPLSIVSWHGGPTKSSQPPT